ncbi:hypothetical protein LOTGIDRAFT_104485 [Lottia gigantea]|uniref:Uncharacterized protein n=1 Tax=Lottia gigantea TaxID=225164 RepID=V4AJX3_LOTGI|nr:hypothetical protein LOTGIDRAFT_104485 [Lottia gigantea]ESO93836.1 hypothetical protein LOTGIDRAFT_104485 [Lottia gigantea]
MYFSLFAILLTLNVNNCNAGEVLGCGGFVRSDIDINFSLVVVKLFTPHGSLKYQTDCAPNTGYYLIPLYDKGDFVMKVEPPQGWSFEPTSVELKVDGINDQCSKGEDINFLFTGFSVLGQVISKGQSVGPAGVSIHLIKSSNGETIQTTKTADTGRYSFTKVLPGEYKVKASHPTWKLEKSESTVKVVKDNGKVLDNLVISGYDVTGEVLSEGEHIKGVNFILFSSTVKQQDITSCEKTAPKGYKTNQANKPLCYVTSSDNGKFVFPSLPTGKYEIIPFYKGEHITFDVLPDKLSFEVEHQSLNLQEPFNVAGFSVSGRVLDSEKGSGVAKAKILINNNEQTTTDKDGVYHLENMKTGTYKLSVQSTDIYFDDVSLKITPTSPQLPNIIASSFSLCGQVIIDRLPEGLPAQSSQRRIIYHRDGKKSEAVSITPESDGHFCTKVKPGKYIVAIHLSATEIKAGLHLSPQEHTVTITNKPVKDIRFSQFRAKVSGTVNCMEKCGNIDVSLDAIERIDNKQIVQVKDTGKGYSFILDNVMPGKYKATILQDSWCWKEKAIEFEVVDSDISSLAFSQTGYILKCSVSHPININFAHEKKTGSVGSFQLNKGLNRFCLAQPGVYKLTPDSCHKFEKDVYAYDTSNPLLLTLTATQHIVYGQINTNDKVNDIVVTITSNLEETPTVLGPLKAGDRNTKAPFQYKFSHWSKTGEKLVISVKSAEVLFYPPSIETTITGDGCPGEVGKFEGRKGVFINGDIKPAIQGASITVEATDGSIEPLHLVTDTSGKFKVGPLHSNIEYTVSAEKDGYIMTKEKGKLASFRAFKLGEISVKVLDEMGSALPGVLLSLSGGNQYRNNNLTKTDGSLHFTALSPGQYFLRPMMKEYKFEPVSQMIDVQEGTTEKIVIKSSRVAYSCYGKVTSLNGEGESDIIVEAVSAQCSNHQEESKTEQDGSFRIRGLQPGCLYEVSLKTGEENKHIERSIPKTTAVKVEKSDTKDLHIIAMRHMNQMDISGNMITTDEFLSTLKVILSREENPDSPIQTISLSRSYFFFLPSVQIDNSEYIIRLETSLSKNLYKYDLPEIIFSANTSYKHFTFQFHPQRRSGDTELSRGSFLVLPFTLLLIYAVYNYQKVGKFVI